MCITPTNIEELQAILHEMKVANSAIHQSRQEFPRYLERERNYVASATQCVVTAQSLNVERITCAFIYCSSTGGVVTLGTDRTFPVPIGLTTLNFGVDGIILLPNDVRQLVQTTVGQMSLELLGQEVPVKGIGAW